MKKIPNPDDNKRIGGSMLWLLVIFSFAVIVLFTYTPGSGWNAVDQRAEERAVIRLSSEAEQTERATTYGWADEEQTAVRVPIERAMELTVEEYQNNQE